MIGSVVMKRIIQTYVRSRQSTMIGILIVMTPIGMATRETSTMMILMVMNCRELIFLLIEVGIVLYIDVLKHILEVGGQFTNG